MEVWQYTEVVGAGPGAGPQPVPRENVHPSCVAESTRTHCAAKMPTRTSVETGVGVEPTTAGSADRPLHRQHPRPSRKDSVERRSPGWATQTRSADVTREAIAMSSEASGLVRSACTGPHDGVSAHARKLGVP